MVERTRATGIVVAHPDDAETMLAYGILRQSENMHVFVASDGEKTTINRTTDAGFCRNGQRRAESANGLAYLGVPPERQHYLGLPDGGCERYGTDMRTQLTRLAAEHGISRLVTLGSGGYDGHPDHIATHRAAAGAAQMLRETHHEPIELYALDNRGRGEHIVYAGDTTRRQKLAAMACHASQFDISPLPPETAPADTNTHLQLSGFAIARPFWHGFKTYRPLILQAETYTVSRQ